MAIRLIRVAGPAPVRADLEAATAALGGAVIELEEVTAPVGRVLRGVFKYPSVPNPMAIHYVGLLVLGAGDVHFRLHTEAVEQGVAGVRETAVLAARPDADPDAPEWDATFPDHPLSRGV